MFCISTLEVDPCHVPRRAHRPTTLDIPEARLAFPSATRPADVERSCSAPTTLLRARSSTRASSHSSGPIADQVRRYLWNAFGTAVCSAGWEATNSSTEVLKQGALKEVLKVIKDENITEPGPMSLELAKSD
jgi:hypothetical protein